jgi:hypothetical protein
VLTVGTAVVVGLVAGWLAAVVTAAAVLVCCRERRARSVLALGAPLWLALAAAWVLIRQWHSKPTAAGEWPSEFEVIHPVGWLAVAFLLATLLVDHAWAKAGQRVGGPGRRQVNPPAAAEAAEELEDPDAAAGGSPEAVGVGPFD